MKSFYFITIITLITFIPNLFAYNNDASIKCIDKQLHLIVHNKQLNLTEDAIVDNTGGYVDIPEEKYYLKTKLQVSKLQGKVIKDSITHNNIFKAIINNKDLQTLQINQELQLIQKIDLIKNNHYPLIQNVTTTNIVKFHFTVEHKMTLSQCLH